MMPVGMDPVTFFPEELNASIFSYLEQKELDACRQVSSLWREVANNPYLEDNKDSEVTAIKTARSVYLCFRYELEAVVVEKQIVLASLAPGLELDAQERSVKTVQLELVRAKFFKLQDKCRELWATHQSLRCKKEGNDNVFRLFGGRAAFQRLPLLDIGDRSNERTSHIDFIRTNEITAPVMRGRDKFGREFFTIRATRGISRRSRLCTIL